MDSNKPNDKRFPMSASIDQIGSDLKKIRGTGVEYVVFTFTLYWLSQVADLFKQIRPYHL